VIVLDGVGAGEAPDAAEFGNSDRPSTLLHVWQAAGGIKAPWLADVNYLSVGSAGEWSDGLETAFDAAAGRLEPLSKGGKDSVTGHWEMMGITVPKPFPTYPRGFPEDLVRAFEARIGRKTLGNRPASGTQIIAELGAEHLETGAPIIYTSADSVFQIACHEEVVPIDELYGYCRAARDLCVGEHGVQRVIARPFLGSAGAFTRTDRRKDFPLPAPTNFVDHIAENTGPVFGIGVVPELFAGRGFREVRRTQNNAEHEEMLAEALGSDSTFIFANFEDTDMRFGHRNDPQGFAECLADFDHTLAGVMQRLAHGDLLIVTADHGNDPTTDSTDHSREYVPFVAIRRGSGWRKRLGDLAGFDHVGKAVLCTLQMDGGFDPFL
jgi:phosphopentomutase